MVKTIKDAIKNYYLAIADPKTPAKYIQGVSKFLGVPVKEVAQSRAARGYILFTYKARIDAQKYIERLERVFEQ